jgi:hypothetical protein
MSNGHERTVWESGWDGHEAQQRARLARLPLADKLRWLEEAHRLVLHLSSAAPTATIPSGDDDRVTRSR